MSTDCPPAADQNERRDQHICVLTFHGRPATLQRRFQSRADIVKKECASSSTSRRRRQRGGLFSFFSFLCSFKTSSFSPQMMAPLLLPLYSERRTQSDLRVQRFTSCITNSAFLVRHRHVACSSPRWEMCVRRRGRVGADTWEEKGIVNVLTHMQTHLLRSSLDAPFAVQLQPRAQNVFHTLS